jgi:dTDP-4-amino-4,6-dideoxygalactose transaminase
VLGTSLAPWPSFSEDEIEAVLAVLRSGRVNYWTGEEGRCFEREFADWVGTRHAIALANGTVAIDLALKALEIGEGDEVIVTPRSFIASASCVVNSGATPIFADVDRDSGDLSAETVAPVLSDRTKAILVVHLGGFPADLEPVIAVAKERGIRIIEDCAQAHGARIGGRSVGSFGDVAAWSFCQDKIMTTGGEGGMVTVNDERLWKRMWSYKDHGKSFEAACKRDPVPGFRWLHESFGTNWRITEMQAAIGRIQLRRMEEWTAARNANAKAIHDVIAPLSGPDGPVRLAPWIEGGRGRNAFYRFYCYVRPDNLADGWSRNRIIREIETAGVPAFQGSCSEIYKEKAFRNSALAPAQRLPNAQELGETSIAFLVHPTLTENDIGKTCAVAVEVLRSASKLRN